MTSPTLITPTTTIPKPLTLIKSKYTQPITPTTTTNAPTNTTTTTTTTTTKFPILRRRNLLSLAIPAVILPVTTTSPARAASDEEYVKESEEVINKVRTTITMDKNDPNIAEAVAGMREFSNSWVAKYRREKELLGRASFRDIYSALNAVSGHYISFGPTAPIPAKRKQRILEEVETAEKALLRGR